MRHFPLFFDLKDKNILIFGGGNHALQRVKKLLPFSPNLRVISPFVLEEIKQIPQVVVSERAFAVEDLSCAPLFVVVAEDEQTTAKIYEECKQRAIPVNAVDMPAYCDLIFPSLFTTENLCIGISSGGKSPTATLHFKDEIKNLVPSGIDQIIDWMVDARERLKTILPKEHLSVALRELFGVSVKNNRPPTADEFAKTIERLKC